MWPKKIETGRKSSAVQFLSWNGRAEVHVRWSYLAPYQFWSHRTKYLLLLGSSSTALTVQLYSDSQIHNVATAFFSHHSQALFPSKTTYLVTQKFRCYLFKFGAITISGIYKHVSVAIFLAWFCLSPCKKWGEKQGQTFHSLCLAVHMCAATLDYR